MWGPRLEAKGNLKYHPDSQVTPFAGTHEHQKLWSGYQAAITRFCSDLEDACPFRTSIDVRLSFDQAGPCLYTDKTLGRSYKTKQFMTLSSQIPTPLWIVSSLDSSSIEYPEKAKRQYGQKDKHTLYHRTWSCFSKSSSLSLASSSRSHKHKHAHWQTNVLMAARRICLNAPEAGTTQGSRTVGVAGAWGVQNQIVRSLICPLSQTATGIEDCWGCYE